MEPFEDRHDRDAKELFNGTVLPAGQSVAQDIDGTLDNLFYHSNTAPFISCSSTDIGDAAFRPNR